MHHPTDRIAHTHGLCYTSREALAGTMQPLNFTFDNPHLPTFFGVFFLVCLILFAFVLFVSKIMVFVCLLLLVWVCVWGFFLSLLKQNLFFNIKYHLDECTPAGWEPASPKSST